MSGVRPPVKLAASLGAGGTFLAAVLIASGTGAVAAPQPAAAADAARWQAGELDAGAIPAMFAGSDWGLTIDTLVALKATGVDEEAADAIVATLKTHVRDYNSNDAWGGKPGHRVSGATAKLLYAAVVAGEDPTKFGEFDLRQETVDLIAGPSAGLENGRLKDKIVEGSETANTFGQSLAVLGLARSGDVPQNTVDFLIDQQCSAGGFRLYPYAFGSDTVTGDCDAQGAEAVLDPDSTAMAVQALLAAADDGAEGAAEAAEKGGAWLATIQNPDGSLNGSGPTDFPNSNSTGLGGQALAATGHKAEADKAADWIKAHQLTASNAGAASVDTGAIAYNDESLTGAKTDGIADFQRDQWRRSTPQALLALAQIPLADIGLTTPDPGPDPSDTPTKDPSKTPSGTPSRTATGKPSHSPSESSGTPSGSPSGAPSTTGTPAGSPSGTPSGTTAAPSGDPSGTTTGTPSRTVSGGTTPPAGTTTAPPAGSGSGTTGGTGALASTGSGALVLGGGAAALTVAGYAALRIGRRKRGSHT
ncbi:hypothetical protein [Streptomyces sp. NPDC085479]|uniref:hypothetical protein n=1 Tax=Streptomyces sp. NPDC085479 TaxID=3365726 RepID=UPI0037D0EEDE